MVNITDKEAETIQIIKEEVTKELTEHIIPFWNLLADYKNGGFYGYMGSGLKINENADKGMLLHSRILWFYSKCFLALKDGSCLEKARHCYDFMARNCIDKEYGGVYRSLKANGAPAKTVKYACCHAFFIYALSCYYEASRDESALDLALYVFETIENRFADDVAYRETRTRHWRARENRELFEISVKAERSMNTILHLIEAYAELFRASGSGKVANRLLRLLSIAYRKGFDKKNVKMRVFFDKNMNHLGNVHSYGNDIQAARLIGRAADVAVDFLPEELRENIFSMNRRLVEKIRNEAFNDGQSAMNYECFRGRVNKTRVWWAQAEAVTGFTDAYRRYGDTRYLEQAQKVWEYIKVNMIDKRVGGEWHSQVSESGIPAKLPVVSEFKCPYHNGEMCLEVGFGEREKL